MKKSIWKFPLTDNRDVTIEMPLWAKIISVQEQFGEGVIWALVSPDSRKEKRYFKSVLTGQEFETKGNEVFIGTYQIDAGNFVVHVFEYFKIPA